MKELVVLLVGIVLGFSVAIKPNKTKSVGYCLEERREYTTIYSDGSSGDTPQYFSIFKPCDRSKAFNFISEDGELYIDENIFEINVENADLTTITRKETDEPFDY